MILTCPACSTRYVVKDGSIPPEGRQVRCAACKHRWHQSGDLPMDEDPAEAPPPPDHEITGPALDTPLPAEAPTAGAPPELEPPAGPEPLAESPLDSLPPASSAAIEPDRPPNQEPETEPEPFDSIPDVEEQRRPRTGLRLLIALLLLAAIAAAAFVLAPAEWRSRLGLAAANETPLLLQVRNSDRQQLASGNELFAVSGRVINPTDERQSVPPLQAELRDSAGRVIYRWTIPPPAPSLGPGSSASFNSAEVDVPKGAEQLTVTLGSGA